METNKRKTHWFKKILLFLLFVFVAIQFIRPAKNEGSADGPDDISHSVTVPDSVKKILVTACYDCHSNKTNYPWYSYIQPVAWWLNGHIKDGKRHLNFSEFSKYEMKRKLKKLDETAELVKDGEMPLESYLIIHDEAKLSDAEKVLIVKWSKEAMVSLDSASAR